MSRLKTVLGFTLLVLAAAGSWYLTQVDEPEAEPAGQAAPLGRGYFLEDARIFGTGLNGDLVYEIVAARAEQSSDKSVAFEDVNIRYSPESDVPWRLDADEAIIDPGEPLIRLRGHVMAFSSEGFAGDDTEIRTTYLELDPDRYIAETDERVQIRIGQRSLTATGMLASLKENQLQLKSNVSGKFVP